MSIQANQGGGVTVFSAGGTGGGGGGTPGGSSGQLQYNASGSFGGMSGTAWNDTTRSLTLTGATVTTSNPVFDLTQTWNAGATTFTAIKMDVTDTASASSSLLLDLQTGGVSQFSVSKAGVSTSATLIGTNIISVGAAATPTVRMVSTGVVISSAAAYGISSTTNAGSSADLILRRAAAASLQLGAADAAAPIAQTLGVQSVVAGTSNTAGTNFTIKGSAGTGTGAGGSIIFQVAPAGSSGTAQNAFANALTIGSSGSSTTVTATALVASSFAISGGQGITVTTSQIGLFNTGVFGWTNNAGSAGALDVILARDAANTLALRNGTSAQTFNVYNTYTDASNYSRLSFQGFTGAGGFGITSQAAGTGSLLAIRLVVAGNQNIYLDTNSTTRLFVDYSGHVGTGTDNTTDLGETTLGTRRFRNIYAGTSVTPGAGVTVASLPTPTTGMVARVTNALAPAVGATVAGGGAAQALVWYNGANWTVIGV